MKNKVIVWILILVARVAGRSVGLRVVYFNTFRIKRSIDRHPSMLAADEFEAALMRAKKLGYREVVITAVHDHFAVLPAPQGIPGSEGRKFRLDHHKRKNRMKTKFTETMGVAFKVVFIAALLCSLVSLDRAWLAGHPASIALAAVNGAVIALMLGLVFDTVANFVRGTAR